MDLVVLFVQLWRILRELSHLQSVSFLLNQWMSVYLISLDSHCPVGSELTFVNKRHVISQVIHRLDRKSERENDPQKVRRSLTLMS